MTPKQQIVYDTILKLEKAHGRYPRRSELARELGISRESARQFVRALEKKGKAQTFWSEEEVADVRKVRRLRVKPL